ncbi:nuclear transport factor 2 family protein [Pseudonocardia xishanensis]|uniref:Nuclear transport factor 2 family protein n=1 Tax=Pseudonocardia xishanensis TaxID=630995 RepID=A0ABP8RQT2_9PSEU
MDTSARVDRLYDLHEIRQLAHRYALAMDSRDLATMESLFVADLPCGELMMVEDNWADLTIGEFFRLVMKSFGKTVHFVGNHVIDVDGAEATGVVYCRAEHEWRGQWVVVAMAYMDRYQRVDDAWRFRRREPMAWWGGDVLERPSGPDWMTWRGGASLQKLPEHWATWSQFWDEVESPQGGSA